MLDCCVVVFCDVCVFAKISVFFLLSCWCCAWLSMVCCGLAEEEWEESGDAVGSCVPCCCPGDVWFDLLLVQALFGGGGGGAPGRSIGVAIETGSS